MRFLLFFAFTLISSPPASADNVCGKTLSPRLQVLHNLQATDAFLQIQGVTSLMIVVYPQRFLHESGVFSTEGIGVTGLTVPSSGSSSCGQATAEAASALDLAMDQMRIGIQGDCFFDDPNLLKPSAEEYRVRWFGKAKRTNAFRISSDNRFPACPTAIQGFVRALNSLMDGFSAQQQVDVGF